MHQTQRGLFWFRHDLRLDDNPALNSLCGVCDEVAFVYVIDPLLFEETQFAGSRLGLPRWQFIKECLADLTQQLKQSEQSLIIKVGKPDRVIAEFVETHTINHIGVTPVSAVNETRDVDTFKSHFSDAVTWHQQASFTLFDEAELPFAIADLQDGFTPFRKSIEKAISPTQIAEKVVSKPVSLPKIISAIPSDNLPDLPAFTSPIKHMVHKGGEGDAQKQLDFYTHKSKLISQYKETRNGLDGWDFSSKLSAYLAQGCLSPRQVMQTVIDYEQEHGANQSTYWLYFELLWREFYQWHQQKYGAKLYFKRGIRDIDPDLSVDKTKLEAWKNGATDSDFVNAFMCQLKLTGWMSNRGRQIVASYFINQYELDWRYGAAWFEQQLIDYDPASNYGNWQYLAGVGVDPRGRRAFNIKKQQQTYDPDLVFIHQYLND